MDELVVGVVKEDGLRSVWRHKCYVLGGLARSVMNNLPVVTM